jgi:hypothetical protein
MDDEGKDPMRVDHRSAARVRDGSGKAQRSRRAVDSKDERIVNIEETSRFAVPDPYLVGSS